MKPSKLAIRITEKIIKNARESLRGDNSLIVVNVFQMREDIDSILSENFFINIGDSEENMIADSENLNCPHCGGSGHVDDVNENQITKD